MVERSIQFIPGQRGVEVKQTKQGTLRWFEVYDPTQKRYLREWRPTLGSRFLSNVSVKHKGHGRWVVSLGGVKTQIRPNRREAFWDGHDFVMEAITTTPSSET